MSPPEREPPREDPPPPSESSSSPSPEPTGPQSPGPESPAAPQYGGPVPPGGWDQPLQQQPGGPAVQGYAVKRGLGRVVGFTLLSLGIYQFYWFYVTREQLTRELGSDDNPGLQTAGLFVPILNIVITYWLWRDINVARTRVGLSEFSIPVYLVLSILGLAPIFYCLVVTKLNEYWDHRTGGQATDAPVTGGEKAVVAVGAAFLALWLLIIVIAIIAAVATS